ncbi:hypothetical protein MSAN_01844400 [Mycena sanguinolenta]|uniref:Uncharacterized protein n=1 Tax=Mycena sanguinolenta TaxID=230812 RepID=A0A8H6XTK6_9AGAR|nr:hypothetical protein MSAN_01844400 [Mycena sanguinolenta]
MTILDSSDQDPTLMKLWALINELGEQLNQNREVSANIYSQAGGIKTQAVHSQTGFVLRRFNLDKPKDVYDAELERMNAAMTSENIALQHDNKQLNALIREYEQTLETLMNTFRNRAKDVQERELALAREYESQLLARQEECDSQDLGSSTMVYESLGRISRVLRQLIRVQGGELPEPSPTSTPQADASTSLQVEEREPWTTLAAREPWAMPVVTEADRALEREIELARLEKENEELRRMLGIVPPYFARQGGEEMGHNPNDHANYSPLHPGRVQQSQPRPFEPPLTMGGFNSPRRPPVGTKTLPTTSLAVRRALGPP